METKSFSLSEFKALDEGGTFEALVAVFGNVDEGGDRIHPGAFKQSLTEWRQKGRSIPVLWSHNKETPPIGVVSDAREVASGLKVKARLFIDDNPLAKSIHAAMKGGALQEFSFGYGVKPGGAVNRNESGRKVRNLLNLHLGEISPVFAGMNPSTALLSVKSDLETQRADLDRKIAELTEQRDQIAEAISSTEELSEETPPPEQGGQEQEDKPPPNPIPLEMGEEAMARIRALQISKPLHLE